MTTVRGSYANGNTDATDSAIAGAECQRTLAGLQLDGGKFLLTFPFIEQLNNKCQCWRATAGNKALNEHR